MRRSRYLDGSSTKRVRASGEKRAQCVCVQPCARTGHGARGPGRAPHDHRKVRTGGGGSGSEPYGKSQRRRFPRGLCRRPYGVRCGATSPCSMVVSTTAYSRYGIKDEPERKSKPTTPTTYRIHTRYRIPLCLYGLMPYRYTYIYPCPCHLSVPTYLLYRGLALHSDQCV
jgi:hypothetical protein